mmetsp:Transcript_34978/g.76553  ORF Transcript_34978/g.76553 Transcript_34978/m.76553 type:complete len:101 (-) Transcript_34978:36-338(-)
MTLKVGRYVLAEVRRSQLVWVMRSRKKRVHRTHEIQESKSQEKISSLLGMQQVRLSRLCLNQQCLWKLLSWLQRGWRCSVGAGRYRPGTIGASTHYQRDK